MLAGWRARTAAASASASSSSFRLGSSDSGSPFGPRLRIISSRSPRVLSSTVSREVKESRKPASRLVRSCRAFATETRTRREVSTFAPSQTFHSITCSPAGGTARGIWKVVGRTVTGSWAAGAAEPTQWTWTVSSSTTVARHGKSWRMEPVTNRASASTSRASRSSSPLKKPLPGMR